MTAAIQSFDIQHDVKSQNVNELGMRVMQARVWDKRNSKNILLKSPPASGKSRALMYLAIDKLENQGVKKVIAAVPEKSIGASFKSTNLTDSGFYADWNVNENNNLVSDDADRTEESKVGALVRFLQSDEKGALVCTHSTLRSAFEHFKDNIQIFEDCLVAIDEFHHLSIAEDNKLGNVVSELLGNMRTHVLGMTGSYFRGDSNAVLLPEHESLFTTVTFTYYEQLQGYTYLKKINLGHHFYSVVKKNDDVAPYIQGIRELYKPGKKTIIHIPQPNSAESQDKYGEYHAISDIIGEFIEVDEDTKLSHYKCRKTGKIIKVANFVEEGKERDICMNAMRHPEVLNQVDVVIAVRMAMEGFDWPAAEMAITVGARTSLTQIIQIIGRVTRDYPGKTEATFVNLIQEPLADQSLVENAVNDILKAISASLLMEQVIAPKFEFKSKGNGATVKSGLTSIQISGFKPQSQNVENILNTSRDDLLADVVGAAKNAPGNILVDEETGAEYLNNVIIPNVIQQRFEREDLTDAEHEELRQQLILNLSLPKIIDAMGEGNTGGKKEDRKRPNQSRLMEAAKRLDVGELTLDMIEKVNPFMGAYEMIAKSITEELLKIIQGQIRSFRRGMTFEEASRFTKAILKFKKENGRYPDANPETGSDREAQLGEAWSVLAKAYAQHQQAKKG